MQAVERLKPQPWMTGPEVRAVVAALTADGAEVRFVGGCVRDALVGRPVRDVDIATHDRPDTVIALLERAAIRAIPTGVDHGTVTAVTGGAHFEITTLRVDVEPLGRKARVAFTDDWTADAARRDFTMNALSCDLDGMVHDGFDGLADLRAGRVRFVGEAAARIREDVLRLLRFFRFHAWYGRGDPDAEGLAACRDLAHLLPGLSAERVAAEVLRLLAAPDPVPVVSIMIADNVAGHILPEPLYPTRLGNLVRLEDAAGLADPIRRLSALVSPDPDGAADLAARLKLSGKQRDRLLGQATGLPDFLTPDDDRERLRALYRHGADLMRDLLLLAAARGDGTDSALAAGLRFVDTVPAPVFPLRGADVVARGVPPGATIGLQLREVEAWWEEGGFTADRAACLERLAGAAGDGPGRNRHGQEGENT